MEQKSWKNQYIDLTRSRGDKIFSIHAPESVEHAAQWVDELRKTKERCILELGSGSGGHLIEVARRNTDAVCFGWERRFKRTYRTIEKAELDGINWLYLLLGEAEHLGSVFPKGSVDLAYLNFPDPWEKRRWKKHRLVQAPFVETLHGVLKPQGIFSFKSDHPEYFEEVFALFEADKRFSITYVTRDLHREGDLEKNIFSEFEMLFRSQKKPVNQMIAQRG